MTKKRRALVTGGMNGIGRGIVTMLLGDGYEVGVLDIAPDDGCAEPFWYRCVDVANAHSVTDAVTAFACDGGIDAIVNNAGITRDAVSWKMTDEQWQTVIDVNLTGVFNCCRAVIPVMRESGGGAIINIASINGLRGKFGQTNYSASKAGVIGLTKALAKEMAKFNITVNAIAPGMIDTAILDDMTPSQRESSMQEIALGRIGSVEDVAGTVAFLCGDRARFITGEVIKVDGGQYI